MMIPGKTLVAAEKRRTLEILMQHMTEVPKHNHLLQKQRVSNRHYVGTNPGGLIILRFVKIELLKSVSI